MRVSSNKTEEEMSCVVPRIPKFVAPEKYTLVFYPNLLRLTYEIEEELDMFALEDKREYLLINGANDYELTSFELYKFDQIADDWIDSLPQKTEKEAKNFSENFVYPQGTKLENVEECWYIKLKNTVYKNEKLKLKIKLKGSLKCIKEFNGLYVCTSSPEYSHLFTNSAKLGEYLLKYDSKCLSKKDVETDVFLNNIVLTSCFPCSKLRHVFPCFDEPCYKAVFSFTLKMDKSYVDFLPNIKCVSNGSLIRVEEDKEGEKYVFRYSDSPYMSCYLFTVTIGCYDLIESIFKNSTKLRVFTPLYRHHDGALCMHLAKQSLKFYEDFFGIPYNYNKLDFVSVPEFDYRALENFGCVVFKNTAMLFGHFQPIWEKKIIMRTIVHEISHMWFGNLVTMEWWDDIWLNEGFARCFEFLCLNSIESKEYQIGENYISSIYNSALNSDESPNTHSVCQTIKKLSDPESIFDVISYGKGSSIIMMLFKYIGVDLFKRSLSEYLKKYQNKNTTTKMLWKCFDEVTKLNISNLMKEWTNIPGHPILEIEIIENQQKESDEKSDKNNNYKSSYAIKLTQLNLINKTDDSTLWQIPVFIKSKDFELRKLLTEKSQVLDLEELSLKYEDLVQGKNFILFNSDLSGFYRVRYTDELVDGIVKCWKAGRGEREGRGKEMMEIKSEAKSEENDIKNTVNSINIIKQSEKSDKFYVSDIDIFGILSEEMREISDEGKSTQRLYHILNEIKPVDSLLLIKYVKHIYESFFSQEFSLFNSFENYLPFTREEISNIRFKRLEMDCFFYNLVCFEDKEKIKKISDKIYIDDTNKEEYKNQFNDEVEANFLWFYCILGNHEEIAKRIFIPNFLNYYQWLNKNYKCTLINIMMKYSHLLTAAEQISLFKTLRKDYQSERNILSSMSIFNLERSIFCLSSCDDKLIEFITNEKLINFKESIIDIGVRNLFRGDGNLVRFFDCVCEYFVKLFNDDTDEFHPSLYDFITVTHKNSRHFYILKYLIKCLYNRSQSKETKDILCSILIKYFSEKLPLDIQEARKLAIL